MGAPSGDRTPLLDPPVLTAFIELAFDRMIRAVRRAPDRLNDSLPVVGSNSPYVLVTHSIGVTDWWLGHVLGGRPDVRDRDAEFRASGTLPELETAVDELRSRLPGLVADAFAAQDPVAVPALQSGGTRAWPPTVAGCLLHVVEELFQHAGHLDITVDVLAGDR